MNMNLNDTINTIRAEAEKKIKAAIWNMVNAANAALDDSYGCGLSGHYASAMECSSLAVKYVEQICSVLETENIKYGMILSVLGSIRLNEFDLPQGIVDGLLSRFAKIRDAKRPSVDNG